MYTVPNFSAEKPDLDRMRKDSKKLLDIAERIIEDYKYSKGIVPPTDFSQPHAKFLEIFHPFLDIIFNVANQIESVILSPPETVTTVNIVVDLKPFTLALDRWKETVKEATKIDEAKSKKGCFIATAVYGTPLAKEIDVLRQFRDTYLEKKLIGRSTVSLYYTISPYIVPLISKSDLRKRVIRRILDLCIAFIRKECGIS